MNCNWVHLMTVVTAAILTSTIASAAKTWTVDDSGGADYTTIQGAIDAASDGDTIQVAAGTYDEAIVMTKALELIGNDASDTIITYTDAGSPVEQNFFLGSNSGTALTGPATIRNFTFRNGGGLNGDYDLLKFRASAPAGDLITIRDNVFDGQSDGSAKGIEEATGAANFLISSNEFSNMGRGIWLNEAHDGTISDNTITGMASNAIGLNPDGPHDLDITGNTLSGNGWGVILGDGGVNISMTWNEILNNTGAGVLYWDDENNANDADDGTTTTNVVINNNDIVGNGDGIRAYSSYNNYGGDPPPGTVIDARMNWWGDVSGPSGGVTDPWTAEVANGSGDSILLTNVAFDDWRSSAIPEPARMGLLGLGGLALIRRRRSEYLHR